MREVPRTVVDPQLLAIDPRDQEQQPTLTGGDRAMRRVELLDRCGFSLKHAFEGMGISRSVP